jgi:transposase
MLGIDVSKDTLACALYDPAQEKFQWEQAVAHTPAGLAQLLQRTPPEVPWVLEPTGRYRLSVARAAREAGRQVLLAPSRKAKKYLQSLQERAKTDRLDSRGLALFAVSRPKTHPLAPYPLKTPAVEQLDQLLLARRGIVEALTSLKQRVAELPHAAEPLRQAVADLEKQRQALDAQIATATASSAFAEAKEVQAVPGIGPVTAAAVVSRLKAKAFTHPDQFVAYLGLDVVIVQSGKRAGQRGLSKQGDAELRRLLYLCARASLTAKESPFRAQYERELAKGLAKTAALNAVARKLARLCWSLVKHGTKYDAARVYQQASSRSASSSAAVEPAERGTAG